MTRDKRTILAIEKQGNIFTLLREFLEAYESRTDAIENGGEAPKLDGIIEMLRSMAGMPAELALVKDELSLVHGLVADLIARSDADLERIRNATQELDTGGNELKSTVEKNQP